MVTADHLLTLAHAYCTARGIALSTLATQLFSDGKRFRAIEDGADVASRRVAEKVQWFAEHWPDGVEWPDDVPRPEKVAA